MDHRHALTQLALGSGGQFSAVDDHSARARTHQAVDRAQHCRFAGARWAQNDAELATRYGEADIGQGTRTVRPGLGNVMEFDHGKFLEWMGDGIAPPPVLV
jgi:hypothetical protein